MVISSKLRRQITNSNLFLSVWASSARTGLTGMGYRSKPSWRFWAPQHLNHSHLSPNDSFILPSAQLVSLPSSLLPQTLTSKSLLSIGFQGRGELQIGGGSTSPMFSSMGKLILHRFEALPALGIQWRGGIWK